MQDVRDRAEGREVRRYAAKNDTAQPDIVEKLRAAGVKVWIIGQPCDLLCYYWSKDAQRYLWQTLECKTPYGKRDPKAVIDKRQKAQIEFLQDTGTPIVLTADQALKVLGLAA